MIEELASGDRNIFKYTKIYSGAEPTFIEGDIFKTIIPLTSEAGGQATMQASMQAAMQVNGDNAR